VTSIEPALAPTLEVAGEAPPDLRRLFVAHGGYVANSLRRLGIAHEDVEDVLHEVFLQVHRHLHEYDPARPARPWLFAFAFRTAAGHRRRAHRVRERPGVGAEAVDPAPRPDEQVAAAQDRKLVLDALEDLPIERRAVFVLVEIDGVSTQDVAVALSIPLNTVYSRLRVARQEFADAVRRRRPGGDR
jgi:RNA polymerase sigma-70 factor (ECF subfamily)